MSTQTATHKHRNVGAVRPNQLMFTYGIGAIVDLPYLSALVMGLDDWRRDASSVITEERLLRAVQRAVSEHVVELVTPPAAPDAVGYFDPLGASSHIGVPVATFPRWMLCPRCELLASLDSGLFNLEYSPFRPEQARYVHVNCNKSKKPPTVVPARFLVACENGHLDDFPWVYFSHRGNPCASPTLRLIEYGPGGEARDLEVKCEGCDARRRMSEAFGTSGRTTLPQCRGRRPHLRDFDPEECNHQVRALVLGASNIWFPRVLTPLAIPSQTTRLDQLVEQQWGALQLAQNAQSIQMARAMGSLADFVGYSDDQVWEAIERKRAQSDDSPDEPLDLRTPEWRILSNPQAQVNSDDFRLRQVDLPAEHADYLDKVVLAERLREVRALIGFTRLSAPDDLGDDARTEVGKPAPLSRQHPTWVPATDVRGEGIFIQFREQAIRQWIERLTGSDYEQQFRTAHRNWRQVRGIQPEDEGFPGLRYVLLHTFAHLLMRQIVLECGYTAASVRERIYSRDPDQTPERPEPMAGILIYTAAPDSEGTLGGLVALGEADSLGRIIRAALRDAQLCASDPLCAEHQPSFDGITLHAAACHACLFAPETSCERGNRYLDRAALVPTVEDLDRAFFPAEA